MQSGLQRSNSRPLIKNTREGKTALLLSLAIPLLSHSSCLVSLPKDSRFQMPKSHRIQSKVAEASETLQVSTSFPPGSGKGVSQDMQ